jgi:hypothetical protein
MGATAPIAMGVGTLMSYQAQIEAGKANKTINEYNARVSDAQATDALARGEETAGLIRSDARRVTGAQRASLAGQGIDLSSGSAVDIQNDTAVQSERDVRTAQANAAREAWGFKAQAKGQRMAGKYAYQGAIANANGSLLTGAAQTAGMWQDYKYRGNGNAPSGKAS